MLRNDHKRPTNAENQISPKALQETKTPIYTPFRNGSPSRVREGGLASFFK